VFERDPAKAFLLMTLSGLFFYSTWSASSSICGRCKETTAAVVATVLQEFRCFGYAARLSGARRDVSLMQISAAR